MTFSIDNPRGLQQPPLGKYVWEKPSGEQGLNIICKNLSSKTSAQKVLTSIFATFAC